MTDPAAEVALADAYSDALDAEYAAVFAYGLIGGKSDESGSALADAAIGAHRAARDRLRRGMVDAGLPVPPPAAAYDTGQIDDPTGAAELAIAVELAAIPRYAALTEHVTGAERGWCAHQAQECATRAMAWGASSSAFPGVSVAEPIEE